MPSLAEIPKSNGCFIFFISVFSFTVFFACTDNMYKMAESYSGKNWCFMVNFKKIFI